jgi:hypothetical protein
MMPVGVVGFRLLGVDIIGDGGVVVARDGVIGLIDIGVRGTSTSIGESWMTAVVGVGTGDGIGELTIEGDTGVFGVIGVRGTFAVVGVITPGEAGTDSSTRISATLFDTPFFPARGAQTGEASLPSRSIKALSSYGLSGVSSST